MRFHTSLPRLPNNWGRSGSFAAEQRRRFSDIDNYPCSLSDKLRKLRDDLTAEMRADIRAGRK